MRKYELSLSPNYVATWGVVEAVREFFQNCVDQQTTIEDNEMFFDYDGVSKLSLGNKHSVLEAASLLMGATTKANDVSTIGQHGEGYKVATLVLTRLGKTVTFYNYGAKEVWKPRFVNSRKYKSKILTFFVDRSYLWQTVPNHDLTITVEGITPEEYKEIVDSNLYLQDVGSVIQTAKGRILEDAKFKGKVFVNGLFVCDYDKYNYGYDFKPQYIKLDRDRKLVTDFDLQWLSSSMWNTVSDVDKVVNLVKQNSADTVYSGAQLNWALSAKGPQLANRAYEQFRSDYGEKAVPISTQAEMDKVALGYKAVLVPDSYKSLIIHSVQYKEPKVEKELLSDRFKVWFESIRDRCNGDDVAMFESLLEELERKEVQYYEVS